MNPPERRYRSPLRAEQSRQTRARILTAARDLLLAQGYAATTIPSIAAAAGVSAQTVYNAFPNKPALVKAVWDVTLVGDDEPVPFAERPEVRSLLAEPDARRYLAGYAALGGKLLERLGPLLTVLLAGANGGDAELSDLVEALDAERLAGTLMVARHVADLGGLREDWDVEHARDAIWTLNSVQVYDLLVRRRKWTQQEYVDWVGAAMADAVLRPIQPARSATELVDRS